MFTKSMSKLARGTVSAFMALALALMGFSVFAFLRPASAEAQTVGGNGIGGYGVSPRAPHNPATQAWFGSYQIPGVGGYGFCIDPGRAAPGQFGNQPYNQPGGWTDSFAGWLPARDADILTNAILAYQNKSIGTEGNRGMSDDEWAAATSIVTHQFGHTPGGGKKNLNQLINEFRYQANADEATKNRVESLARDMDNAARNHPRVENAHLQISTPQAGGSYQVMVMVTVHQAPTPPPPPPAPPVPPSTIVPDNPVLMFSKTDEMMNPLAGATIQVRNVNGELLNEFVSDGGTRQEILIDFEKTYGREITIQEVKAPEGYKLDDTKFNVLPQKGVKTELVQLANEKEDIVVGATPNIKTKAVLNNSDNVIKAGAVVTDTVSYVNLEPGTEYTIKGELMCTETGESTGAVVEKTFIPTTSEGETKVEIPVKNTDCETQTVFETLYLNGEEVAKHTDINDVDQTVGVPVVPTPEIGTQAQLDGDDNVIREGSVVTDTVSYTNLEPGREYTLTGELMCTETGESTGATATVNFTPEEANGTVNVEIPVTDFDCETQTVFETLYLDGEIVAEHKDISDKAQTVGAPGPEIGTKARLEGDSNVITEGSVVVDTVSYRNLKPGVEYTLTGELMCTETGDATGATNTVAFTPESANGEVEVEIQVTDADCYRQTAFETLKLNGNVVAEHKDINDEAQTVGDRNPEIGTRAELNNETSTIEKGAVVTDTVTYAGLTPGREYTLTGELICTETGESTGATATARFTPEESNGQVKLPITVNDEALDCEIQTVFESLYLDGQLVAEHKDINDEAQTVGKTIPKEIGTKAELNGGDNVISENDTVTDTVSYTGLTPGKEYRLVGELYCTSTEKSTGATAEMTFVPEERNGFVTLTIPVKDTDCGTQTVFETLFDMDGEVVATHHDITDVAQTVGQPVKPKPAPKKERVVIVKIPSGVGTVGDTTK